MGKQRRKAHFSGELTRVAMYFFGSYFVALSPATIDRLGLKRSGRELVQVVRMEGDRLVCRFVVNLHFGENSPPNGMFEVEVEDVLKVSFREKNALRDIERERRVSNVLRIIDDLDAKTPLPPDYVPEAYV